MARAAERLRKVTIAEFDEIAEKATEARDCELIDGEIVMMTNPAETHEQIASNIGARLKLAMDSRLPHLSGRHARASGRQFESLQ
jgi:Uma2 family endonuclease